MLGVKTTLFLFIMLQTVACYGQEWHSKIVSANSDQDKDVKISVYANIIEAPKPYIPPTVIQTIKSKTPCEISIIVSFTNQIPITHKFTIADCSIPQGDMEIYLKEVKTYLNLSTYSVSNQVIRFCNGGDIYAPISLTALLRNDDAQTMAEVSMDLGYSYLLTAKDCTKEYEAGKNKGYGAGYQAGEDAGNDEGDLETIFQ